jgi:hypothetical protein
VSVLWSQAPPDARRVIQEAQQGAVDAALKYLEYTAALIDDAVRRHGRGDWGEIGVDDMQANDMRATEGGTIASIYTSSTGIKFYVLTEADRSVTTVLLPEEY